MVQLRRSQRRQKRFLGSIELTAAVQCRCWDSKHSGHQQDGRRRQKIYIDDVKHSSIDENVRDQNFGAIHINGLSIYRDGDILASQGLQLGSSCQIGGVKGLAILHDCSSALLGTMSIRTVVIGDHF